MCKKVILFVSAILLANISIANNLSQTIRGSIVDATTGFPLIGANIVLLNSDPILGTTSDINGNFELLFIPLGRQSIQISYLGYKTQTMRNILVTSGKQTVVLINLEEDVTNVEEVVIKARTNKEGALNEMASISARTFSIEETERFAGSLGDPARMVSNYAGVATANDSRNDIIIRGNSPSGVLWRLEGVEVPNPNHFGASGTTGGPVSMINNNLLANSDFLTGAFPAEYGNALAGAFDLNLRSGNTHNHEFIGQVGFNGFELGAEGPMFETKSGQKASYLASFRYSTLDIINSIGFSVGTGTAVPKYKDFTFMVDIPGTKAGRFKVFGLWGNSYIELGREYTTEDESSYSGRGTATNFGAGLGVVGASHTYFFNSKTRVKSTVSYQSSFNTTEYDSVKNSGTFVMPVYRSERVQDKISFTTQLKYKLNSKNNFSAGIIIDHYLITGIDSSYQNDYGKFITIVDMEGNLNIYQAHAQWQHKFTNNITTYAGLHSQFYDGNNDLTIEPRLGLNWQANKKHSFSAGFGLHSQTQPKATYFLQTYNSSNQSYYTTNESLKFTQSIHYVLGYNYLINENLRVKTETYYQSISNVPVKESFPEFSMLNSGASFGPTLQDSLVNEGTGTNYGVEITFEKFLNKGYYFLLTTSLFNSTYTGYDGIDRNTAFNGNYILNALAGYEYNINESFMLTFDIRATFAGGQRYVPIDLELSQQNSNTEYDWSNAYNDKHDDYFRTDIRIGFKHNGKRFNQEWGVDLQNVTNYQSIFMQGYDVDKDEVYTVYQQGFMPMFLYRIQF